MRRLFRWVCDEEYKEIVSSGCFRVSPGSVEGKYFATSPHHAAKWGLVLPPPNGRVIAVDIPEQVTLEYLGPNLDQIGPAYFAHLDQLPSLRLSAWPHQWLACLQMTLTRWWSSISGARVQLRVSYLDLVDCSPLVRFQQ